MHILIIKNVNNDESTGSILDARIIPADQVEKYAQRAADFNRRKGLARNYSIEEHSDDSLAAFLALDRQYDMDAYMETADDIYKQIKELSAKMDKLNAFYNAAAAATAAPSADEEGDHNE